MPTYRPALCAPFKSAHLESDLSNFPAVGAAYEISVTPAFAPTVAAALQSADAGALGATHGSAHVATISPSKQPPIGPAKLAADFEADFHPHGATHNGAAAPRCCQDSSSHCPPHDCVPH